MIAAGFKPERYGQDARVVELALKGNGTPFVGSNPTSAPPNHEISPTSSCNKFLDDMRIPDEKAILALNCLLEGCSTRSTQRLTGLEKKTILLLLVVAGGKCQRFMDRRMRNLDCRLIQADEIWSFVFNKDKRVIWRDSRTCGCCTSFRVLQFLPDS